MSSAIELGKGKAESEVRNETYTIGHKNRIWLHGSGQENEVPCTWKYSAISATSFNNCAVPRTDMHF